MTEQLDQQLSAFMDDELSEQEGELFVRRLCKESALQEKVNRFALMGDAMRGELLAADAQLCQSIRAAIISGVSTTMEPEQATRSQWPVWLKPVSGVAVAATVAAVALLSLNGINSGDNTEFPASTVADINRDDGALRPVNLPTLNMPEVIPASAIPQSRMDQYLLRHREYANSLGRQSVMGIRDVGSYNQRSEKEQGTPASRSAQDKADNE